VYCIRDLGGQVFSTEQEIVLEAPQDLRAGLGNYLHDLERSAWKPLGTGLRNPLAKATRIESRVTLD